MLQRLFYPLVFIRVKINHDKKVFVALDEVREIENTCNVVFLYSPDYRTVPKRRTPPMTVFRARACDITVSTEGACLVSFLRQGRNLYTDSLGAADEHTKYKYLFDAHNHFRKAIMTTSMIPDCWYIDETADEDTIDAYLCLVQCEVKLAQYKNARAHLQRYHSNKLFTSKYLFWYLLAVTCRKQHDYQGSLTYLNRAVVCVSTLGEYKAEVYDLLNVERQLSLDLRSIKNLPGESVFAHIQKHFKTVPFPPKLRKDAHYNILCLDGGGIKGIIAALLLVEIEKRAQRPITSIFHHIAGTSTGAIIAGALSIPHPKLPFTPKFSAYEVLEMYADPAKASQIFQRTGHVLSLFGAKYSEVGREKLIREYYGAATFSDALVNLSIVAINETIGNTPIPFTKETHPTVTLTDAVMASSAAPTYFKSHSIDGTHYIDGGLKANNPSKEALSHAKDLGIDSGSIRMLSIGCGDVCPLYSKHGHGILYHGLTAINETIRAQQVQADRDMVETLGSEYERWQLLFEEPTGMDDITPPTMLNYVEHAKQFIKENDDRINALVDKLLNR